MSAARRKRTGRVTNVDPWVVGGDGEFRDLLPLSPWLILGGRFTSYCVRNWKRTFIFCLPFYLYFAPDPNSIYLPLIITPTILILYYGLYIGGVWYKSPDVPFMRRK